MNQKTLEILLVEDNPGDVRLAREAFREAEIDNRISVTPDGVEALSFLRRQGRYGQAARPDMILLDLNLPRKDGREVLAEIKVDAELCEIPVVVLSTSSDEADIRRSYDLHANCYVTKPADLDRYIEVMRSIEKFWVRTAQLPHRIAAQ